jgi:hypothetical protein
MKYTTFDSSREFVDWQKQYKPNIYNIVPLTSEVGVKTTSDTDAHAVTSYKVFVTYSDKVPDNEN